MTVPRRIRVAYCIDSFVVGGTEMNAVRTAEALDAQRFELRVFHLAADGPLRRRYEALGLELTHVPIQNLYSIATLGQGRRFGRQLREWRTEVTHTHDLYTNIFAAPWARLVGGGGVLSSRRWWYDAPRPGLVPVNRWCNRFAHRILANSQGVARLLIDEEKVPARKVVVIPNFLDDQAFERPPAAVIREQRQAWRVPAGAFLVGIVARLAPVKNHTLLLRAIALASADVHLVIIGDGPARGALEALTRELRIGDRVHFTGEMVSQSNLHSAFDLSALCSTSEGFPNAVIEALAVARPVLATPVGGVLDVIEDGVTGVLTPLGDAPAMAAAIERLRADPEGRARLGAGGFEAVSTRFRRRSVIDQLSAEYESLASGGLQ